MVNNGSVTPEFNILDRLPTGACVLRNDFSILFWNARLEEWTGISRDAILGTNILKQFPLLKEPRFHKRLESVLEGGLPAIFSSKLHKYFIPSPLPGGQMRQQQTTVTPLDISDSEERQIGNVEFFPTEVTNNASPYTIPVISLTNPLLSLYNKYK